jgi:hypothetical protein
MREPAACALLLLLSIACVDHDNSDSGMPPNQQDEPPRLAEDIGIELGSVGSFVVQLAAESDMVDGQAWRAGGQQLFALTLDGELIELSLTEPTEGGPGSYAPPFIAQIHSTPQWIVFSTPSFVAYEVHEDMDVEIPCSMIAARRSDGALFCAGLGVSSTGDNYGNSDPGGESVLGSADGQLLYVVSRDEFGEGVVYRVETEGEGLSASLIEPIWRPRWLAINPAGDLLANYRPAGFDEGDALTQVYPADGTAPIDIPTSQTAVHRFGIAGERNTGNEDDFYMLEIESGMVSRLRTLDKQTDGFVHTEYAVELQGNCAFLHPLADGIYSLCGGISLARVIEDGVVQTTPPMIPIMGISEPVSVGGQSVRFAENMLVLSLSDGTTNVFVRHDGVSQQTIPYGAEVELLGFAVAGAGDINFMGVTVDTHARVIGTVPAGADAVEILDYDEIDPASVIAFTRIN